MLIDNRYIIERYKYLLVKKQSELQLSRTHAIKFNRIKLLFPSWLRKIIFHPLNPFYSVFLQYKNSKSKKGESINLQPLQPFAVDFIQYCLSNAIHFETNSYYPSHDEPQLISYIDNRLMSCIPGYNRLEYTDVQIRMLQKRRELGDRVTKTADGFSLLLDGNNYFLPVHSFDEPTYIHGYGLKYLPAKVIPYISGKDFLDIGAYLGDTSVYLARNYNPGHIYAYEPVQKNVEQLEQTIKYNNTKNISVIFKGIGSKEEEIDIYVHPDELSGSSINSMVADTSRMKERIQITTIDKECLNRTVGLIKMDIEGAEYGAIHGALETIKRDRPVLLISLYHTATDFFEIPRLLKETVPDYRFRFLDIEVVNPFSEKILAAYPESLEEGVL